jgi:hypothetical protein
MPSFTAITDFEGHWLVNQYTPTDDDRLRQETIADHLEEAEALALAEALNAVADRWWLV